MRFSLLFALIAVIGSNSMAQVSLKGRVFDQKSFAPIFGATVAVQGTTLSTTTNANGDFTLGVTPLALKNALNPMQVHFEGKELSIWSVEAALCELFDVHGKMVWTNHSKMNSQENLTLPSGGLYIYKVSTTSQIITGRLALTSEKINISIQSTKEKTLSLSKTNAVNVVVTKSGYYTLTKSVNNTETGLQLLIAADTSTYCGGKCAPASTYKLVWASEFDSTALNKNHWGFDMGDGCPDLCGWGNSEREYYTDRSTNVRLENGKLIIEGRREAYQGAEYTSAKITTRGKKIFRYGRIEAMIKMPQSDAGKADVALWAAFWMMPQYSKFGGWPRSGEIDIVEWGGKNTKLTTGTAHWGNPGTNHPSYGGEVVMPWNLNEDYHLYRIEWDSLAIRWYLDERQISMLNIVGDMEAGRPFHEEFYIILNLAIGGNWAHLTDSPNAANYPSKMFIDWIRVFQK